MTPRPASAGDTRRGAMSPVLRDYLARFEVAARVLPFDDRQDLRSQVWRDVAAAAGPAPTEERLTRALDGLGPPEGLVPTPDGGDRERARLRDPAVPHLLGCSLLTFGVTGVIGLVRIWRSPTWPVRDALVVTVLVVAGAVLPAVLTPVHPLAGAVLGGLGAGALVAAMWSGALVVLQRRRYRRSVRAQRSRGRDSTR